ncbi:hypothetical protein [Candidatus Viridilinea mediisalina]|uniref:Uncharacterized protein n=1 Tax=Candidatus Viridilinea mediisalina TaxID=2024553 RepID=A0A2A6RQA1_9CHLR|nr:hypothetical protein [Candidatus Viridilinea mediisalina]PDW05098.1 hypothetical protein CJ255_00455 [Candidatus Viridilinea mediisalina]
MDLFHHDVRLGTLVDYGYATPWAEAWLRADTLTIQRYAAIYAFRAWVETIPDDLPDDESDARYEEELRRRGLDEAQVAAALHGWAIRTPDGAMLPVSVSGFEADGYITWRW